MTRITKEPEERRQEIIDTAMMLFYERGYEKTSITDIAKAMHVAQGLCYRYFPSKEVLFDTAIDQLAGRIVSGMASVLNQQTALPLAELIRRMPTFLDLENDESFVYKLCHGAENSKIHDQLSMCVCSKLLPIVRELLERAVENGELAIADPLSAASFCVYGQLGILLNHDLDKEDRVKRTKAFLMELISRFGTEP